MQFKVDVRYTSYDNFVIAERHQALGAKVEKTKLSEPILRLCLSWDAASTARAFPVLMLAGVAQAANESLKCASSIQPEAFNVILSSLSRRLKSNGARLDYAQQRILRRDLDSTREYVQEQFAARQPVPVDKQALWGNFIKLPEAANTLFHSQQMAVLHLYSAYESTLNTVCKLCGVADGKIGDRLDELEKYLNGNLKGKLWSEEVQFIGLLRHAITHNGGYITGKLEKVAAKQKLTCLPDKTVFIEPLRVVICYRTLLEAIEWFVDTFAQNPKFK